MTINSIFMYLGDNMISMKILVDLNMSGYDCLVYMKERT